MNLRYTLPDKEMLALQPHIEKDKIIYCAPYDITTDGNYFENGWFCVTKTAMFVFEDGIIKRKLLLSDCADIKCVAQVDNGIITATINDVEELLLRMSMMHISRYAYIARGTRLLIKNKNVIIESMEAERICPICKRALPGTQICPICGGRKRAFKRIAALIKPYGFRLSMVSVFMLIITFINIVLRFFERDLIDKVLTAPNGVFSDAIIYILLMFFSIIILIIMYILRNRYAVKLGSQISLDLREKMYIKVQELSIGYLSKRKPGELMNRIANDTNQIRRFMQDTFAVMFNQLITMITAMVVMFVLDWQLTLLTIALVPVSFYIAIKSRKFFARIYHKQWTTDDQINSRLQDVLSGIRVVKSYGTEQREADKFAQGSLELAHISQRNEKMWSTLYPLFGLFFGMGALIVGLYGGIHILGGTFTVGKMMQFVNYANILYGPMLWMGNLPRSLVQMMTSLERIYDVLDEQPDLNQISNPVDKEINGDVSLEEVTFGYKTYEPVLDNISINVKKGEMIGLVGASGAGKSTIINLIMRMYDVDDGVVKIDGIDIKEYSGISLHNQLGVVLQEPFLFSDSVLENLHYSKPKATYEEIIQAAKLANAHDFIMKFPDAYNTRIGENGHNLSGGERQRIAIARAILNDPKIIILDEATSSLDTETEYQIQEALGRLIKGRTTFAIAHRLATLRNADRIYVIDNHTCAESGTHNELIKKRGIYYKLVMAQLQMNNIKDGKKVG